MLNIYSEVISWTLVQIPPKEFIMSIIISILSLVFDIYFDKRLFVFLSTSAHL